jgi:hypothetical protein
LAVVQLLLKLREVVDLDLVDVSRNRSDLVKSLHRSVVVLTLLVPMIVLVLHVHIVKVLQRDQLQVWIDRLAVKQGQSHRPVLLRVEVSQDCGGSFSLFLVELGLNDLVLLLRQISLDDALNLSLVLQA